MTPQRDQPLKAGGLGGRAGLVTQTPQPLQTDILPGEARRI